MDDICAIVLAAGLGTRFVGGERKVLALHAGRPLVVHAVATAMEAGVRHVVVVTGEAHEAVVAALQGGSLPMTTGGCRPTIVRNEVARSGMASSIRLGIETLPARCRAVFMMLADMPCVRPSTLSRLATAYRSGVSDAVVPVWHDQAGNPALLASTMFEDLLRLTGDAGARRLLSDASRTVERLVVDDPGVLVDVDTREALSALR